jgi:glycolate oxidase FAD binding subunit
MAGIPTSRSPAATENIPWQELEAILSATELRAGAGSDSIWGIIPTRVATPLNEQQMSSVLRWADNNSIRICVSGGGTKQEWSGRPEAIDLLVSSAKLNVLVEHAHEDLTVTVQAGQTVAQLQLELARHNQRLALDVLWPERATIGGIIATNDNGSLRLRYGSARDLLIGITVVLSNGTIARSGGRVVKNVAGYDLPKLFTGSLGTLGVITEATFRVHPLPHASETVSYRFSEVESANKFILALNDSALVPAAVQLRYGSDQLAEVDVMFQGVQAGIDAQKSVASSFALHAEKIYAVDPWSARQALWTVPELDFICKFSVLPSDIAAFAEETKSRCAEFRLIAQATGLGHFAARCSSDDILHLRKALNSNSGNLTILSCRSELTPSIEKFDQPPDSFPLMVRVKQRFDPKGTLNRGRFIGGI